jgi:NAD-dependent DNA ligase
MAEEIAESNLEQNLSGLVFVVTGSLTSFTRDEAKERY